MARSPETVALLEHVQTLLKGRQWAEALPTIHELATCEGLNQGSVQRALGKCLIELGQRQEGLEACERAIQLDPSLEDARATIIFERDLEPNWDAKAARQEWWRVHGLPLWEKRLGHTNTCDPNRVLRVGYVSGDFRFHSASVVFAPVVLGHSDMFKVYAYSTC